MLIIKKIENTVLVFILTVFFMGTMSSQGLQLDINYGVGPTFLKVHHKYSYKLYDNLSEGANESISLGLTGKIGKKLYLRTGFGLNRIDYTLRIDYDYKSPASDKPNLSKKVISMHISNKRMYFGIYPEYRHSYRKMEFFMNTGLILGYDINTDFSYTLPPANAGEEYQLDDIYFNKSGDDIIIGGAINTGINYNLKNMALRFTFGASMYNKTNLFGDFHPDFSYMVLRSGIGIVYFVDKGQ